VPWRTRATRPAKMVMIEAAATFMMGGSQQNTAIDEERPIVERLQWSSVKA